MSLNSLSQIDLEHLLETGPVNHEGLFLHKKIKLFYRKSGSKKNAECWSTTNQQWTSSTRYNFELDDKSIFLSLKEVRAIVGSNND